MISRYEFKYLLDPATASEVVRWARVWMTPDAFGDGTGGYRVTSLYLDREDRLLAQQTWEGVRERVKLRIRFYGEEPETVFAEVKKRVGSTIEKLREPIETEHASALAENGMLPPDAGAPVFRQLCEHYDARPALWVRYLRQAFSSPWGDGTRLTLDRALEVQDPDDRGFSFSGTYWRPVPLVQPVILELKFNGAYPAWMRTLAEGLRLERTSCSKYAQGVERTETDPFSLRWVSGGPTWRHG